MTQKLKFALVVAVAAGCARPAATALTEAERAAIGDSVTAAMRSYEAAIKVRDAERVLAHYVQTPQFRLVDNETVYSYDALRPMVQGLFGSLRSYEGGFGPIHVNALSRDVALADAPYTDVYTDTTGTVTRVHGVVTWVWVHGADGWRIVHGQAFSAPDTAAHR
jgi:ketosteroid isomerase-like protein